MIKFKNSGNGGVKWEVMTVDPDTHKGILTFEVVSPEIRFGPSVILNEEQVRFLVDQILTRFPTINSKSSTLYSGTL